jgi:hypothetical protein
LRELFLSGKQMRKSWFINVASFFLLSLLCVTGLINWLVLPRGYRGGEGFLFGLRHFLIGVHEWAAVLFLITIAIHIALHWGYVRANLRKKGH